MVLVVGIHDARLLRRRAIAGLVTASISNVRCAVCNEMRDSVRPPVSYAQVLEEMRECEA